MLRVKIKLTKPDIISAYLMKGKLFDIIGVRRTWMYNMTSFERFIDYYTPDEVNLVVNHFRNHPPPDEIQKELTSQLSGADI